jgi:hypothetical protein
MVIAMTVGATKIQIIQEKALASLPQSRSADTQLQHEEENRADQEACSV